jgi:hypothetical protein
VSEWVVPIVSAVIALAGGVYATRGKQATDRSNAADRMVDQVQEERNQKVAELAAKDAVIAAKDAENERLRGLRQGDADYIVRLRRQIEQSGGAPEPYPGMHA